MDNKRKNNSQSKFHTDNDASPYRDDTKRHGNATEKGYGTRPIKRDTPSERNRNIRLYPNVTETDKHRSIEKAKKRERLKKQQLRTLAGVAGAIVFAIVLMFMTPLFNIREIRLSGNDTVSKDVINAKIGNLIGANLFGTSVSGIEEKMTEIPQISDVDVKKAIFPTRLELAITESRPAAYVLSGNATLVIDSGLKIIDDASVFDYEKLPSISGISVSDYELNTQLEVDSDEKRDVLIEILSTLESCALIDMVKYISVDDLTSITFNYDNRIEVLCGSPLQMERKIRMFSESIRTSTFDEYSRGSVDISVPGKGYYDSE